MAGSDSRRRKQLEKKKKKRSEKKHQLAVRRNAGIAEQLLARVKYPIHECFVSSSLTDLGAGEVLISRRAPSGEMAYSLFLIDRYCLGVKDCFGRVGSGADFRKMVDSLAESGHKWLHIDPASARKLVEDAAAYAESLGLKPHSDFRAARMIFGDIDTSAAKSSYEMGRDGKPCFIAGPMNSTADCKRILARLTESCGPDGFHFTMPIGSKVASELLPSWDDELVEFDESDEDEIDEDDDELLESDSADFGEFDFSEDTTQQGLSGEPAAANRVKVTVVDPKHPDRPQD